MTAFSAADARGPLARLQATYGAGQTGQQELQSQPDALEPVRKRIFSEKVSTRVELASCAGIVG
ncbi:hypothetical protein [Streptomyces sp. NPDC059398]|uniref:hypothetical protein n=1 Tax=Streptomyces sp. NPDC059398 TaxID=3346820 RepID=UPI0036A02AF6